MKTEPIAIDGVAGPVVVATNAFWGRHVVTVAGQTVPHVGKRQYALPGADGVTVHATLRSRLADPYPALWVNGIQHRTGPKVPVVLQVLALLPIALVSIGGALGGVIGALGVMANLAIARTRIPSAGKAPIMIGIGLVAVLVYLVIAAALRGAINHS
ncbi:MAG TPA: hypothetical protein VF060_34695 [Trebonia sp.]